MLTERSQEAAQKSAAAMCRRAIVQANMSQLDIAKAMRCNNTYVSDVLNGRRGMTPRFIGDFAKAARLTKEQKSRLTILAVRAKGWEIGAEEA